MKRLVIPLMIAMMLLASCASTPRSYEDLTDIPGVSSVYLGPTMLGMASSIGGIASNKVAALRDNLTSLRVITANDAKAVQRIRPFIKREIRGMHLTPEFQTTKSNGEQIAVYTAPAADDASVTGTLVVVSDIGTNLTVMMATGNFTQAQIKAVAN